MRLLTITILFSCCILLTGCGTKENKRFYCENYYDRAEGVPTAETDNLYIFKPNLKYLKTQCVVSKKYINE